MDCYQVNCKVIKIVHDAYLESSAKSRQLPSEEPSHQELRAPHPPKEIWSAKTSIAVCSVSVIP